MVIMIKPMAVVLRGRHARLEPLTLAHVPGLFAVGREPSVWRWMIRGPFENELDCQDWIAASLAAQASAGHVPFAIVALDSGRVAGCTRYFNVSLADRGLEIGHTWLGSEFQRTAINTECKWLLLQHAFEKLQCARVQLKTDALNVRSRAAIERIGAKFEGILRKYQLTQNGRIRDTAMYSVTEDDWPTVRELFQSQLLQNHAS